MASASTARGELVPFTATLTIRVSLGLDTGSSQLLSVSESGMASVSSGVVQIPSGVFDETVPAVSGFGGMVVNVVGSFSPGGAGPPLSCPLTTDNACVSGGGFGGGMALGGITQKGQGMSIWGVGGSAVDSTASGDQRVVRAAPWSTGTAEAWFYVLELDPGTPFLLSDQGSFRGLPSTISGTGPAGFTMVTPVVVTSLSNPGSSVNNVRGVARLRIDFEPELDSVPVLGSGIVAFLLCSYGTLILARGRRARAPGS
jgi:hypothetical protein